jgi:DNA integrity scanning protein DisA with diadenylate cyclase activity
MEVYRTLDLVHRFPFKPQVEVVVDLKEILVGQKSLQLKEQVVLVDQAVVLVVTLILLLAAVLQVLQTLHHLLVNLVTWVVVQTEMVPPPQVEVVVLVVPDKIIDQTIMQDTVVLD